MLPSNVYFNAFEIKLIRICLNLIWSLLMTQSFSNLFINFNLIFLTKASSIKISKIS